MSEVPIESGATDLQARPPKTGRQAVDLMLGITAIFISAVSLYVAVEHGKTERDLVAGSTWPSIQAIYTNSFGPRNDLAIGYANNGVGPAKIKWLEVYYNGRPLQSDIDLLHQCCDVPLDPAGFSEALPDDFDVSIADQTVLRPGDSNMVLVVHRLGEGTGTTLAQDVPRKMNLALKHLTFRACYCSALDQCWISALKTTDTIRVQTCPKADHPFDPPALPVEFSTAANS